MTTTTNMTAAKLISQLTWAEVSSKYAPDCRRVIRDERIALTAAAKANKGVREAMAEAIRVAEMWGVDLT